MQTEKGFTLIETLVALALVGLMGVITFYALSMANNSTIITGRQTTAESLARSQMDYIQNQPYDSQNNPPVYTLISSLPTGYSIATPIAARLDPQAMGSTAVDEGLQQITVTVKQGTRTVYTLIDYKVNR